MHHKLRILAQESSTKAYSPYSHACVGAAIELDNGHLYGGCNVENASYGATICAERNAIFKAVSEEHRSSPIQIVAVYVYSKKGWPPCGMCRQVISEFATSECHIIVGDEEGKETILPFTSYFPQSFNSAHLSNS